MVSQDSCASLKIHVYENFLYTFSNQKPLASKKRHLDLLVRRHGFSRFDSCLDKRWKVNLGVNEALIKRIKFSIRYWVLRKELNNSNVFRILGIQQLSWFKMVWSDSLPCHYCPINYLIKPHSQFLSIYRSGTFNSNTVNSKFHLIRSFFEILARILSFHV